MVGPRRDAQSHQQGLRVDADQRIPERYPELSDADLVNITRPTTARAARRNLLTESWNTLRALETAGELRIEGRRVMPPLPPRKDESPD